ncbi:hypothetical protein PV326_010323 [Microctonus aethiopoides]|nr:hypothetical protein PV326_010323 [Microctonus aethiopoides]
MSEVIPAQKSEKSYESLPNETFYIVCGVKSGTEFNIILSKLSPKPAKATIVIFVGEERKDIEIDNWTNKPISDVIPSFIQADQDYDFSCEIIWKGFHDTKLPSSLNLHHHIEKFLEKPDFKDFVIKIETNEIPVHKVILAAFSRVFSIMLQSNMRETAENQLVVKDIEFDIMKLVIEFMYSGKIDSELPVDDLLSLKYADDIVIIPEVKKGEDVSDEYTGFHTIKLPSFDDVHRHLKHFQSEFNFTDSGIKIDNNNISVHKVILNVKR